MAEKKDNGKAGEGETKSEPKKHPKKGFAGLAEAAANATETKQLQAVVVEMCNELDKITK